MEIFFRRFAAKVALKRTHTYRERETESKHTNANKLNYLIVKTLVNKKDKKIVHTKLKPNKSSIAKRETINTIRFGVVYLLPFLVHVFMCKYAKAAVQNEFLQLDCFFFLFLQLCFYTIYTSVSQILNVCVFAIRDCENWLAHCAQCAPLRSMNELHKMAKSDINMHSMDSNMYEIKKR